MYVYTRIKCTYIYIIRDHEWYIIQRMDEQTCVGLVGSNG